MDALAIHKGIQLLEPVMNCALKTAGRLAPGDVSFAAMGQVPITTPQSPKVR